MGIKGTVTISLRDFNELNKKVKDLERDNERLNNIIKLPEVSEILHHPS